MSDTFEAVYEDGVLKPTQPLSLNEHERVQITIESTKSWAERTAGMLQWTGDPEVLRQIAEDDEFGILESPLLKAYGIMGFEGTAEVAEYFAVHPELLPEEGR